MLAGVGYLGHFLCREATVDNLVLDQESHIEESSDSSSEVNGHFNLLVGAKTFPNIHFLNPEIKDDGMAAQDKHIGD